MAEIIAGVGVAASIAGLITLADAIYSRGYELIKNIKDADESIEKVLNEVNSVTGILHSLKNVTTQLEQGASSGEPTLQILHLNACHQILSKIQQIIDKLRLSRQTATGEKSRLSQRLHWPLNTKKTNDLISDLQKHKATLTLALNADSMQSLLQLLRTQDDLDNHLTEMTDEITGLRQGLEEQSARAQEARLTEEKRKILASLTTIDPWKSQRAAAQLCQEGTGAWFTDSPKFRQWLGEKNGRLWLQGIPGAGKTVLTSTIVKEAQKMADEEHGLAFFYCDYKHPTNNDAGSILRSIIKQISLQNDDAFEDLENFYQGRMALQHDISENPFTSMSHTDLLELLVKLCNCFKSTMIIIDALDEIETKRANTIQILRNLYTEDGTIKVLFTSRSQQDVKELLKDCDPIQVSAQSSDVTRYVAYQISHRMEKGELRITDDSLKQHIMTRLVEKADGMFRWVACQLDYLCELPTDKARREGLETLPPTLDQTYNKILEGINTSTKQIQSLAIRTLRWVLFAVEPLPIKALLQALAIEDKDVRLDSDNMASKETILRSCSSLLRSSADGSGVELAHFTVKEYLLGIDPVDAPKVAIYRMSQDQASLYLARTCLTYLSFDVFDAIPPDIENEGENWTLAFPLLPYAARHWIFHAYNHFDDEVIFKLATSLFEPSKTNKFISWSLAFLRSWHAAPPQYPNATTLHWAACLALTDICKSLLAQDCDVNGRSILGTPLYCALGRYNVLQGTHTLLSCNCPTCLQAHFNKKDTHRARLVELLIESGARSTEMDTGHLGVHPHLLALTLPCEHPPDEDTRIDYGAVVKILLNSGIKLRKEDIALAQATFNRLGAVAPEHAALFDTSVKKVIGENVKESFSILQSSKRMVDEHIATPPDLSLDGQKSLVESLASAVRHGQKDTVARRLAELSNILDSPIVIKGIQHALQKSVATHYLDIIKLLMDKVGNINFVDEDGDTLLHLSFISPSPSTDVVRYLVDRGVDTQKQNNSGLLPLHLAACKEDPKFIQILLETLPKDSPQLLTKTTKGNTPLMYAVAAAATSDETFNALLNHQTNNEFAAHSCEGISLVHWACLRKTTFVLSKLIERGIDIHSRTPAGSTAMHYAANNKFSSEHVKLLLEKGMSHSLKDNTGYMPIHVVADNGRPVAKEILEYFLQSGADVNAQTDDGKTPLHFAIGSPTKNLTETHLLMLEMLLGCDSLDLDSRDDFHRSPLIYCCRAFGRSEFQNSLSLRMLRRLLDKGADPKLKDTDHSIALHYLCSTGPGPLVDLAIEIVHRKNQSFEARNSLSQSCFDLLLQSVATIDQKEDSDDDSGSKKYTFSAIMREEMRMRWQREVKLAVGQMTVAELERPLSDGKPPLTFAVCGDHDSLVRLLLEKDVNVDITETGSDQTALDWACSVGCDAQIAQQLIAKTKRNINALTGPEGASLLHAAVWSDAPGSIAILRQLVRHGADLEVRQRINGHTALTLACSCDSDRKVEILLEGGALVDTRRQGVGGYPLHFAANANSEKCIELMLDAGANIESRSSSGKTPLYTAATYSAWKAVKFLIDKGASIKPLSTDSHILRQAAAAGSDIVVKVLVDKFKDIDMEMGHGADTDTPLLLAVSSASLPCTELLVEAGASLNATSKTGNIVHRAVTATSLDILKFLTSQKVDWQSTGQLILEQDNSRVLREAAPLHRAAYHTMSDFLEFLLGHAVDANPNVTAGSDLICPLHITAMRGFRTSTRMLLARGADATVVESTHGWTPLHYAARFGKLDLAKILLQAGNCGIDTEDLEGYTPAVLANVHGNLDVAKEILGYMRSTGLPVTPQGPQRVRSHTPRSASFGRPLHQAVNGDTCSDTDANTLAPRVRTWRMPLNDISEVQNAINGNLSIYAIDTSKCSRDVLKALKANIDSGVSLLDEHVDFQVNWGRSRKPSLSINLPTSELPLLEDSAQQGTPTRPPQSARAGLSVGNEIFSPSSTHSLRDLDTELAEPVRQDTLTKPRRSARARFSVGNISLNGTPEPENSDNVPSIDNTAQHSRSNSIGRLEEQKELLLDSIQQELSQG